MCKLKAGNKCIYVIVQGCLYLGKSIEKGEKRAVFKSIEKWQNAAAYAAEGFVLQETFLKLKISGL